MNNIYIGWDAREDVAYKVCKHSILRRTRIDANVMALKHTELREQGVFRRPWLTEATTGQRIDLIDGRPFSTEFSHTRFLVPYMNDYKGWSLFMDCDMIFQSNIRDLFAKADDKYAVMVVKHTHKPTEKKKMDGQVQTQYYRKNWSSFILWNCAHPANKYLTPERVSFMLGSDLHAFDWLEEKDIGHLGFEYNWIEGVSPAISEPAVIHYTLGGPWFESCQDVMYADKWMEEYEHMQGTDAIISEVPTMALEGKY